MSKCTQRMLEHMHKVAQDMPPAKWSALASRYDRKGWTFHIDPSVPTIYAYHYDGRRHGHQAHRFAFLPGIPVADQLRIIQEGRDGA